MRRRTWLVSVLLAALLAPAPGTASARPAIDPDAPTLLLRVRLHQHVRLHRRPGARVIAVLGDRTEFGSRTTLTVLARRGRWAQVSVAVLGGRPAWLRLDGHIARRGTRWGRGGDISDRSLAAAYDGR